MMSLALIALGIGGALAVLLMIPFVAISYRRRGGLSLWRGIGWLALLIYFFAIWTYTLLPIPSSPDYPAAGIQLDPMTSVRDIKNYGYSGVRELLHNEAVQQLVLNVILFIPLGFLIRTLFRRGFLIATLSGFLLSLLIELTQLTAVWGLFPRPYRVFDVNDLLTNTAGALIGSILAFIFVGFARREELTPGRPRPVTSGRRFLGMACDVLFVVLLGTALLIGWRLYQAMVWGVSFESIGPGTEWVLSVGIPLLIQFLLVMFGGSPLGERAVLLEARYGAIPVVLSRFLRFLCGIGGFTLLWTTDWRWGFIAVPIFVLASVIAVWATPDRRGLAALLSGSRVVDAREVSA